ncbi:MAG: hypothetical protein IPK82_18575 [Polyangiaceae bacterium]|nr:hypothetical protein [Polyangiaceae bacterium]
MTYPYPRPEPHDRDASKPFPVGAPPDNVPPLYDPFLHQAPPPKKFPWLLVIAGITIVSFVAAGVGVVWMLSRPRHKELAYEPFGGVAPTVVPHTPAEPSPAPSAAVPQPQGPSSAAPSATVAPSGAPLATREKQIGTLTVVDLGTKSSTPLADALSAERSKAQKEGQQLLVMTTQFGSKLLDDFERTLPDPRMQTALSKVRLVRVDSRDYDAELTELGMGTTSYPWFFLLGPDLIPRDGINGGEWDDDIAVNIAPVLGAFVKGTYKTRRERWKPPPGKGITL